MNKTSTLFILKNDGITTPCRLMFKGLKEMEIVRFEIGLAGKPKFSEEFKDYGTAFLYCGIFIPDEIDIPDHFRSFIKKEVTINEIEFGEAFYRYFFPKLKKNHPHDFTWEKLES